MGHRAPHRADERRHAGSESGVALPGSAAPAADGLDHGEVGRLGQQPESEVLFHHADWTETAGCRNRELATAVGNHRPLSETRGDIMTSLRMLLSRVFSLFRKRRLEQELDDELQFHFEREIEEHVARGLSPAEARRLALKRFGHVDGAKETYRDARGFRPVENFLQDVRYAMRTLWH